MDFELNGNTAAVAAAGANLLTLALWIWRAGVSWGRIEAKVDRLDKAFRDHVRGEYAPLAQRVAAELDGECDDD